jgi:DNA-binding transcriptional LysR family regulator
LLAAPLAEFARKYPQITIDITLTARMVDLVQERFDIALRATDKLDDSSLVARRLSTAQVGMYASRDYVKRRGKPKTVSELANHDFVMFRGRNTLKLDGPDGEVEVAVRGPINVDDVGFVRLAVLEGAGIGLMPLVACGDEVERILPEYASRGGSLYLVMPSGRHLPARVALFRDFLVEKLKDVFQHRMRGRRA